MDAAPHTPLLRRFRLILWTLVVLVALGATALYIFAPPKGPAGGFGQGSYSMLDQTGKPVDQTIFTGHPSLLFFGYTHCPDVCPTTLAEMATWFQTLGPEAKDLKAYFVTVDPTRDTPKVLGDYVSWVPQLTGLTGTQAQIDQVTKAWGVLAEKVPADGEDYSMNHTASVFLLDRNGQFQSTIAYGENADTAVGKIKRLIGT